MDYSDVDTLKALYPRLIEVRLFKDWSKVFYQNKVKGEPPHMWTFGIPLTEEALLSRIKSYDELT